MEGWGNWTQMGKIPIKKLNKRLKKNKNFNFLFHFPELNSAQSLTAQSLHAHPKRGRWQIQLVGDQPRRKTGTEPPPTRKHHGECQQGGDGQEKARRTQTRRANGAAKGPSWANIQLNGSIHARTVSGRECRPIGYGWAKRSWSQL